jgi:hypothetical protein
MICSELVARGLMRDIGIGRYGSKAMELLTSTDLAKWLIDWISEPEEKTKNKDKTNL